MTRGARRNPWRDPPWWTRTGAALTIPTPRCAVCRRPVGSLSHRYSPDRGGYVVTVSCHGATEESFLPIALAADGGAVVDAVAFKPEIEGPTG